MSDGRSRGRSAPKIVLDYLNLYVSLHQIYVTLKGCWNILGRHQHDERHVKVVRDAGKGQTVVGVHDEEGGAPGEREEVTGVEATVFLKYRRVVRILLVILPERALLYAKTQVFNKLLFQ